MSTPFGEQFLRGWVTLRGRFRGIALPVFALPLIPTFVLAVLGGNGSVAAGAALGFGAAVLAVRVLRREQAGDIDRAALIMGVGAGLAAHLAAERGVVLAGVLGAAAWLGTRLSFAALPEAPAPPPPAAPLPPGPLDAYRARVARVLDVAALRQQPRLAAAAQGIGAVLDEVERRPERLGGVRRFLTVQLDGLDRIAERLGSGAAPPATLDRLLQDLDRAARDLRDGLRREETEALEVQVKVLSDRLRQEGYST